MASTVFATVSTPGPAGPPGYSPRFIVAAGAPTPTTGNNGDMYIDSATGNVYGPKTSGSWGAVSCNIKGPTGAAGYSPQYIVAAGAPSGAVGNNGDMYIDSITSNVYGPKAGGLWGSIVCNIKGATGATGASGATGPQGPPGVAYTPRGAWAAGTTYAQGDEVTSSGSQLYISLQSGNVGHDPATSPTWWQALGSGAQQTPWLQNIDGATFNLSNTGNITAGAATASGFRIAAVGTKSTVTSGDGAQFAVMSSDALAANPLYLGISTFGNATAGSRYGAIQVGEYGTGNWRGLALNLSGGSVGINNDTTVSPAPSAAIDLLVGGISTSLFGRVSLCGNTSSSSAAVGVVAFGNYGISGAEKRLAQVVCATDGAINSGYLAFTTFNAGVAAERMRITSAGLLGIGTATPQSSLDVAGMVTCKTQVNIAGPLKATSGSTGIMTFSADTANRFEGYFMLQSDSTATSRRLSINCLEQGITWRNVALCEAGGNVGFGTIGPQALIHGIRAGNTEPSINYNTPAAYILNNAGVEIAMGCSATVPYPFWVQSRINSNNSQALSINPLGGSVYVGIINGQNWSFQAHKSGANAVAGVTCDASFGAFFEIGVQGQTVELHGDPSGNFDIGHYGGVGAVFRSFRAGAVTNTLCLNGGCVGVGTANPNDALTVNGRVHLYTINTTGAGVWYDGNTLGNRAFVGMQAASDNVFRFYSTPKGNDVLSLDLVNGFLGIGIVPSWPLQVIGDVNISGTYRVNGAAIGGGGVTTQSNVTASRSLNTNYGVGAGSRPVFVNVTCNTGTGGNVQAMVDASAGANNPTVTVGGQSNGSGQLLNVAFWVLPGYYFRLSSTGGVSIFSWVESY